MFAVHELPVESDMTVGTMSGITPGRCDVDALKSARSLLYRGGTLVPTPSPDYWF